MKDYNSWKSEWRDKQVARGICPECCKPNASKYKLCFNCRRKRAERREIKRANLRKSLMQQETPDQEK